MKECCRGSRAVIKDRWSFYKRPYMQGMHNMICAYCPALCCVMPMLCCDVVTRPAVSLLCVSDAMFGQN